MSKKHCAKNWFTDRSDVVCTNPKIILSQTEKTKYARVADMIQDGLYRQCERRLYTGDIRGSRTARVKRVLKNVHYWFLQWIAEADSGYIEERYRLNQVNTSSNRYGDQLRDYTFDITSLSNSYFSGIRGRLVLEITSVIRSTLIASKFKRWFVEHFPQWHNPLNDKFSTCANVILRIWFRPDVYCDITVYSIKINSLVYQEQEATPFEKRHHDERIAGYFEAKEFI